MCYSSAVTNLNRITVPSPVTEITEVSNKPWTDKLNGLIYTESENDDSDASINKNPKTNNSVNLYKFTNGEFNYYKIILHYTLIII